jgi:MerR family transcriptional regulator, light-induced transcriptional regulator
LNIQAVAQKTGIPAATLRKWEQRYGVLNPERTAGAHRRYSERDVLRVEWLKARLAEGYRIGEAARLLGGADSSDTVPSDPAALVRRIVDGASATDPAAVERAVEQALALFEARDAIDEILAPALREVGECWARGELGIGQEHGASEIVRAKLRELIDTGAEGPRGTAVLCCAPRERHEIGLLALGVLLQTDGWGVVYLGADTPLAEAVNVATARGASLLCVSATMADAAEAAGAELAELADEHDLDVVVGGPGFDRTAALEARSALRRPVLA